jgi:hypothetical protein
MTEPIVVTVRLIRSFQYRNIKNIVLHTDPSINVAQLKEQIRASM